MTVWIKEGTTNAEQAGIVAVLRDNGENPVPPQQAVAVMAIVEAALRASTTGTTIDLLPG